METALDLLRMKGERPLFATSPATTVLEATKMMNDERIGSLLVMHAGRLVGMFTERDVLRRVVAEMRRPESLCTAPQRHTSHTSRTTRPPSTPRRRTASTFPG